MVHLPLHWQGVKSFKALDRQGAWQLLACEKRGSDLVIRHELAYLTPLNILAE